MDVFGMWVDLFGQVVGVGVFEFVYGVVLYDYFGQFEVLFGQFGEYCFGGGWLVGCGFVQNWQVEFVVEDCVELFG